MEYPIPPLFIVTEVIIPLVMFAVAVAVDPIPVAIPDTSSLQGDEIFEQK